MLTMLTYLQYLEMMCKAHMSPRTAARAVLSSSVVVNGVLNSRSFNTCAIMPFCASFVMRVLHPGISAALMRSMYSAPVPRRFAQRRLLVFNPGILRLLLSLLALAICRL